MRGQLERARAGHQAAVLQRVLRLTAPRLHDLHGADSVARSVLQLGNHLLVGALQQQRAGEGVSDVLDEAELVLADGLLVHVPREAQNRGGEVVHAVHGDAAAGEREALHVAAFGAAQREDVWR